MDSRNADFNLLLPLRALLDHRSVSRAAEQLGISQPTMSGALQRLRVHFGDPLLVRKGNGYDLTPLAIRLHDMSAPVQWGLERLFTAQSEFDPTTSRHEFTIRGSDYSLSVMGSKLAELIRAESTGMVLHLESLSERTAGPSTDSLRGYDGAILPHGVIQGRQSLDIFEDQWVCVAWEGNEQIGERLTIEQLSELPWVYVYGGPNAYNPASKQMETLGINVTVEVFISSFLALPSLIVGTPRIAFMQAALAIKFAHGFGIRILDCPFDVGPLKGAFWWHPIRDAEPEHLWLRQMLLRTGDRLRSLADAS